MWTQLVDATPSNINLLTKGGIYDPREAGGAPCDAENRHMVPLEGGNSLHEIGRSFGKGAFVNSVSVESGVQLDAG